MKDSPTGQLLARSAECIVGSFLSDPGNYGKHESPGRRTVASSKRDWDPDTNTLRELTEGEREHQARATREKNSQHGF
uniref:Glycogen branching enzyme n=1 Tax=Steinernema glaseri TaxID=37863 RepID=A0A1I7Z6I0_9BILA